MARQRVIVGPGQHAYVEVPDPPRRPLPCLHLGARVAHAGCACRRNDTHVCDKGHGHVRPAVECEACDGYEPD